MNLNKRQLNALQKYFSTQPVLRAYLFGSYARGQADRDSDVDILVDLDYSQRIGLQFMRMQQELEHLLETKVDLVSANGLSPEIKPLIEAEKRLIYAR